MFPRLIQLGPFPIHSFGLMVVLGFAGAAALASRLARERGLPGHVFFDGGIWMLLGGVIGARLVYIILNAGRFAGHPLEAVATWQGGMSFHGGAAGGVLAGMLFLRSQRLPIAPLADAAAPALSLGYAIGRVGCLLNGCCYGGTTNLPWGLDGAYCLGGDPSLHYHPAQVYAAMANLVICGLLIRAYRSPHRHGQILALWLVAYSVYRFLIEGIRSGVTADVAGMGLTQGQWASLLGAVAGVAIWRFLGRVDRRSAPAEDPTSEPEAAAGSS